MIIAGTDEVGRGPLAGPVTAAAVIFPEGYINPDIKDSKKLSAKKRGELVAIIKKDALAWAIVSVGHRRIDSINIREASRTAMSLAVKKICKKILPDLVRVDGNVEIPITLKQETVIGGDNIHVEISAASIIAKVHRDKLMEVLDAKYPGYGLGSHAGYATEFHRKAIARLGPSPIHRRSFYGVKEFCK